MEKRERRAGQVRRQWWLDRLADSEWLAGDKGREHRMRTAMRGLSDRLVDMCRESGGGAMGKAGKKKRRRRGRRSLVRERRSGEETEGEAGDGRTTQKGAATAGSANSRRGRGGESTRRTWSEWSGGEKSGRERWERDVSTGRRQGKETADERNVGNGRGRGEWEKAEKR